MMRLKAKKNLDMRSANMVESAYFLVKVIVEYEL
jgi:hypothetical protein